MSTRAVKQVNQILRPMGARLDPKRVRTDMDIQACMASIGSDGSGWQGVIVPHEGSGFDITPMGLGEWNSPFYTTFMTSCMAIVGMYATMEGPQRMLLQPIVDGIQQVMTTLSSSTAGNKRREIEEKTLAVYEEGVGVYDVDSDVVLMRMEDHLDNLVDKKKEIQDILEKAYSAYDRPDRNSEGNITYRKYLNQELNEKAKEIQKQQEWLTQVKSRGARPLNPIPSECLGATPSKYLGSNVNETAVGISGYFF